MIRRAIEELGELAEPATRDTMLNALASEDYAVRHAAAVALGKFGPVDPKESGQ